ncbi:phosphate ABC transporter permease subunit PstC [Nocardioides guangzhouensis]|uniref:Phosphate transport system permease protein n=1 Tax=Nocardioides guangzhouensis TaxID=2497878 RepID=A0A4Q4ZCY7_9ACTN|nr:phosphate ABC transporter permease subunit PstC [Nocardioides guangzhouensis]RYP85181.1 phosphate ABC transporter permease subunit PstC [Nocardioides guangzhouensis]
MSTTIATRDKAPRRRGDVIFAGIARGAGIAILVALAGVALFLTLEGFPALGASGAALDGAANFLDYVWPLVFGTLLAAILALLIATPLAIGVALVIAFYTPRRISGVVGYMIDLLAAVPSVVYGLWGIAFLGPQLKPLYQWLEEYLGFLPFFAGPASSTGRTILTASIVLAIMVLPIITAISREIFTQTPQLHMEAAMALGATRWEMIKLSVFPYARSGMVSATMLGLGRALGETMAVAMVLSASGVVTFNLISSTNPSTIAANIALNFPEATGLKVNALIASGLVLFVITFAVNFAARAIVARTERERS